MKSKNEEEREFLEELNKDLPQNVNWKEGAIAYTKMFRQQDGERVDIFYQSKPFRLGDAPSVFVDFYHFLNMVQKLKLSEKAKFLDVGCGPGWFSHYLAKFGYSVVGIDISEDMIEQARKRLDGDPLTPYGDVHDAVSFFVHDIEEEVLPEMEGVDCAIFESSLHHFINPLRVIRNVSEVLNDDGYIAIIEGQAADVASEIYKKNLEIMNRYKTLERPYTRKQLEKILELAGFSHYEFYFSWNGIFEHTHDSLHNLENAFINGESGNICIASRSKKSMARISPHFSTGDERHRGVTFQGGFFQEEFNESGQAFYWSRADSQLVLENIETIRITISSCFPEFFSKEQNIYVYLNDQLHAHHALTERAKSCQLEFHFDQIKNTVRLMSDSSFSPQWFNSNDKRILSFQVVIDSVDYFKSPD